MTDSKSKRHIEAPRAKQKQGVLNIIWPREAGQLMKHNGLKWVCSSYKGVLINRNYGLLQRNSEKGNPWPGRETTTYQVSLLHSPDTPFPIMASINQIPQEARVTFRQQWQEEGRQALPTLSALQTTLEDFYLKACLSKLGLSKLGLDRSQILK